MFLLCRYASRVSFTCNLLYYAVHADCLSARGTSPPMATECVYDDLTLLFEFLCQVRRYQPLLDHLGLPIKHMQICYAFCPCLSVHIFRFYIRQGGGALVCVSACVQYIKEKMLQQNVGAFNIINLQLYWG